MFDVSFTELLVIGVVALVVIGPERLPKVARTLGHLVGRAQRYVNDVKSDIQREVELDELRKLKDTMKDAANSVQSTLHNAEASLRAPLDSIEHDTMSALKSETSAETTSAATAAEASTAATTEAAQIEASPPPSVTISDSASAMAHVQAAEPTSQPTQLEIEGVPHVASTATTTPGSKT